MIARRKDAKPSRKTKKRAAEDAAEGNRLDHLSSEAIDAAEETTEAESVSGESAEGETGVDGEVEPRGKGRRKRSRRKKARGGAEPDDADSSVDGASREASNEDASGEHADAGDRTDESEPFDDATAVTAVVEVAGDDDEASPSDGAPRDSDVDDEGEVRLEGLRLRQVIESILFAAGEPISAVRLRRLLPEAKPAAIREELLALQGDLASQARGFTLVEENGGYRLLTRMEFAPYVSRLRGNKRRIRLSKAAFETLAVIAYRQPVRRADLDAIRGVQSSAIVKNLLEWNLVKVVGQDEGIGKALLFGTTVEFLDQFGLASLGDLPHPSEFSDFGSEAPSEIEIEDDGPIEGPEASDEAESPDGPGVDDVDPAIAGAEGDSVESSSPDTPPSAEIDPTDGDADASEPVEVSLAKGETGDERA